MFFLVLPPTYYVPVAYIVLSRLKGPLNFNLNISSFSRATLAMAGILDSMVDILDSIVFSIIVMSNLTPCNSAVTKLHYLQLQSRFALATDCKGMLSLLNKIRRAVCY